MRLIPVDLTLLGKPGLFVGDLDALADLTPASVNLAAREAMWVAGEPNEWYLRRKRWVQVRLFALLLRVGADRMSQERRKDTPREHSSRSKLAREQETLDLADKA